MSKKGSNTERELSNILEDSYDYACLRAPASGGATDRARPDLVAIKGSVTFAIELKSKSGGTAYLDEHEVNELEEWATRAGATSLLGVKPDLRSFESWFFISTNELPQTDSGNYAFNQSMHDKAKSIDEQFGERIK